MSWTDADVVGSSAPAWSDDDIAVPEKKSMLRKSVEAFLPKNIAKQAYGALETATQMGTGAVGQVAGGLAGLGTLATGGGMDKAADRVTGIQNAMTYQPRTDAGKSVSSLASIIPEGLKEGSGWVGEKIGGDAGRAIGEIVPDVAMTIAGGIGALRAAPKGASLTQTMGKVKDTAANAAKEVYDPSMKAPTAAQVSQSRQFAPAIDAANIARKYDIAIDPTTVNPTRKNRLLKALSGDEKLSSSLAAANEGKWSRPLKQELGMEVDRPISIDAINRVRDEAAAPNRQIEGMGRLNVDPSVTVALDSLFPDSALIGGDAAFRKQSNLSRSAMAKVNEGITGAEALENISQLRKEARDIYNAQDPGRARLATADTSMGIANALEQLIENNLAGNPQLLNQYRQGRKKMAQSYVLEDITDMNTGVIDPLKLAKLTSKDNALTGAFADVGKLAGVFPEIAKAGEAPRPMWQQRASRTSVPGIIAQTISGTGAAAADLLSKVVGGKVRERLSSSEYQAKNSRPVDYRPMRERMGYSELPPEPAPWSLAPEGEALPTSRTNVEPTVRPTLELMDNAEIQSQALRGNKGAQTPMGQGDAPIEFTPGGGMDFKTPVQKVHELPFDINKAIEQYTKEAQNAMTKAEFDNAMANLDAFKAMAQQEGLSSNLQPLYQPSNPAGFPIQKVFDPRSEALRRR